jgi:hypothetical protein
LYLLIDRKFEHPNVLIFYIIIALAATAATVFAIKSPVNLSVWAVALIVALISPFPVHAIVMSVAKSDKQTYHEYWNGYETDARAVSTTCVRDGSCVHEYNCDPYTQVYYDTVQDADGKGTHQERKTRTVYHDCPYSTQETTYLVDTTLNTYTVGDSLMTGAQYRFGTGIPGGRVTHAPAQWSAVKHRIDIKKPGGVSKVNSYKNYILASEGTVFKRYSDEIDELKSKNLLPSPSAGIGQYDDAIKVSFVGNVHGIDKKTIRDNLNSLNGAVGSDLNGDVRMVFVNSSAVGNTEDYGNALMAYWQSSKTFGRDALAKNAIVIIVGVEKYKTPSKASESTESVVVPTTTPTAPTVTEQPAQPVIKDGSPVVAWTKAYTGMPIGNEALLTQLQSDLKGDVIDKNFIGNPTIDLGTKQTIHTDGKIESILFGTNKFDRVSMSAKDSNDSGSGFNYLADEWQPDTGAWTWFFVISTIVFLLVLGGGFFGANSASQSNLPDPARRFARVVSGNNNKSDDSESRDSRSDRYNSLRKKNRKNY